MKIFAWACGIPCIGDVKRIPEHGDYTAVSDCEQQSARPCAINLFFTCRMI
jgi:hypothetical protein